MREGIHPKYVETTVTCACGFSFKTHSIRPVIKLDICSNCHPFFTGKQKLIDSTGTVERFHKRFAKTGGKTVARKSKTKAKVEAKRPKGKILSTSPKRKKSEEKKESKKEK